MKHLPNALTLCNLFCGCCALLFLFHGQPETAAWLTAASFLFDYLDGTAARALKAYSPLGKELDSLADVVSFGVVPGAIFYQLAAGNNPGIYLPGLPVFVLSAFSALRLAKFNIDTRQTSYFIGLSTPACTIFVLGLSLSAHRDLFGLSALTGQIWVIYALVLLLSWLLIAEIPMFGMKIKGLDWKSNRFTLLLLGLFALMLPFLKELALSGVIICYILLSIVFKHEILSRN